MILVRVFHSYYHCETGCCGHTVEIDTPKGSKEFFEFTHPYGITEEYRRTWARELAESVIRKKWPECFEDIDWDSMSVEVENNC